MANYSDKFFEDEIELTQTKRVNPIRKYAVFIIAAAIATIVALWFLLSGTQLDKSKTVATNLDKHDFFIDISEFTTTMLPTNNKQNYLKVSFSLQVGSSEDVKAIELKMPMIKDAMQVFLRELRVADISYSGGVLRLKEEMLKRVNKVSTPIVVKDVLLKEIIIN